MQSTRITLGTQLFLGIARPLPELIQPIENADGNRGILIKPLGGLWTSSWDSEKQQSGWTAWCIAEAFENVEERQWWLLSPLPTARILEIDTLADLSSLLEQYRLRFTGKLAPLNDPSMSRYLDYERLSKEYDALHLTEEGQWHTRLTHPDSLYGWDCECTCWFRWCFSEAHLLKAPLLEVKTV